MPEGRPRDYQVGKVYAAEHGFDGYAFTSAGAVQAFVKRVLRSATWKRLSVVRVVEVKIVSRRRWYAGDREGRFRGFVALRGDAKTYGMEIVIHELTHITIPNTLPDHGREFCRNELILVRRFMGPEAEADLRSRFEAHGVEL